MAGHVETGNATCLGRLSAEAATVVDPHNLVEEQPHDGECRAGLLQDTFRDATLFNAGADHVERMLFRAAQHVSIDAPQASSL